MLNLIFETSIKKILSNVDIFIKDLIPIIFEYMFNTNFHIYANESRNIFNTMDQTRNIEKRIVAMQQLCELTNDNKLCFNLENNINHKKICQILKDKLIEFHNDNDWGWSNYYGSMIFDDWNFLT